MATRSMDMRVENWAADDYRLPAKDAVLDEAFLAMRPHAAASASASGGAG